MAAAKMRHFNSPEEIALREGQPAGGSKKAEFRHYNHPEEIAKRAAAGKVTESERVLPQRRPLAIDNPWPPLGEPNNAPVDAPAVLVEAGASDAAANEKPDTVPPPPRNVERLRRLEALVLTFCEDESEARHFRMLLNNQQAVTDSQKDLINRVRALEDTIDRLLGAEAEEGAPEVGPAALELEPAAPVDASDDTAIED